MTRRIFKAIKKGAGRQTLTPLIDIFILPKNR